jgi:hypothetical protein
MGRDNTGFMSKLKLRRHMLTKHFGTKPFGVLDACEGDGHIWKTLKEEFNLSAHLGIDIKEKAGRLAVNSEDFLKEGKIDKYDVFDLDAYGSPFPMYESALSNLKKEAIFFLTFGSVGVGFSALSRHMADVSGFFSKRLDFQFSKTLLNGYIVPPGIFHKVRNLTVPYCINRCEDFGFTVSDFVEVTSSATTRYFGIRVVPNKVHSVAQEK